MWPFKNKRSKFGEILVEKGLATPKEIEDALEIQKEMLQTKQIMKTLGTILYEKGIIELDDIDMVLEEQKKREGFILKGFIYSIFHSGQPK